MTIILNKPEAGAQDWDVPVNENWEMIEEAVDGLDSGKATTSLDNLDADGQALFSAKLDADKLKVVEARPANPDPDTFYFIPE